MEDFSNLDTSLVKKIIDKNIVRPTSIQKLVIPRLINKKDIPDENNNQNIIFRSQTGTGKTYAYLLPIIQNILHEDQSYCLIIAPTLELGAQIKSETDFLLSGLNINAELITGSGNIKRQIENIKKNRPRILIGNSKRILELIMLRKINLKRINTLVLDEADRIMSMESIDDIKRVVSFLPQKRVNIACSATMNVKTQNMLKEMLGEMVLIESDEAEILRENITHIAVWTEDRRKIETLRSFLSACKPKKALVFCERGDKIEKTASSLEKRFSSIPVGKR
ncbi:hypothetical protein FACS1894190_17980 [Spirochaetia bacterium]|nr:hypothetical protein FACS1894190_17980 [Spirochaetia bacterium]